MTLKDIEADFSKFAARAVIAMILFLMAINVLEAVDWFWFWPEAWTTQVGSSAPGGNIGAPELCTTMPDGTVVCEEGRTPDTRPRR